jgi:hypothetical protein
MLQFKARIEIIGVNPYVLLPAKVLKGIFDEAGKEKGPIPVCGTIDGHKYIQTLVKYSGAWRLYLNMPMRKAAGKDVGDTAEFTIAFDPADRTVPMPAELAAALKKNKKAQVVFDNLIPSRKKEIMRYINSLKTEESVDRNVARAIKFLLGKERFIARDNP